MKKLITYFALAAVAATFTACNDDDEPKINPDEPTTAEGAFVLNQGSYYSNIEGSLSLIDYDASSSFQNIFQQANGRSIGATPQSAIVYGEKIYIGVYQSNTIEIINRNTYKSEKQISLANAEGQLPRSLIAKDGKVYISMYDGHVSRLDTASLAIEKTVEVGPNPEIMVIKDDCLYVPNSGGLNYENGYNNTASVIDLKSFTVKNTFEVPTNPTKFITNGKDLFLLCMGNYYDELSAIYKLDGDLKNEKIAECTYATIKDNKLYIIDAPWYSPAGVYSVYDTNTKETSDMINDEGVESVAGIGVDPINGNIVITSYSLDNGYTSYNTDGYAKVYDANGNFLRKYNVGVAPSCIFFNYK